MLVFSAIVPHPPVLMPKADPLGLKKVEKTKAALEELKKRLEIAAPETIIIFSPHGKLSEDAFAINLTPSFKADFEEFGDFETKKIYKGDLRLMQEIQESLRYVQRLPVVLTSEEKLDHGITIPLHILTKDLKNIEIIPLYPAMNFDAKTHFNLGGSLKDVIVNHGKKIAVLASAGLSHCLSSDAPAGFSPKGKEFDEKLMELLVNKNVPGIVNMNQNLIDEAKECGLHSISMLLGLIEKINYTPEIISYENKLGVGYMTAHLKF